MNKEDVKILETTWLYQGFLKLKKYRLTHKLFAGGWTPPFDRELSIRVNAAAALLYDPILDKVVLIEQFRIGALEGSKSPWLIEIVAGLLDANETAEDLIRREAQEEAGLRVLDLIHIYDYWSSPGASNERLQLFCAKVDASHAGGIYGLPEENEDIRAQAIDSAEAFSAVQRGEIDNATSIIALQWLQMNKKEVQQRWLP